MTARHGMNVSEAEVFLPSQTLESSERKTHPSSSEASDLEESVTHFLGGLSGLLFALSLSFFLQAPVVSGGVLIALALGWTGQAFYSSKKDQNISRQEC